jgi:hypothetical protein
MVKKTVGSSERGKVKVRFFEIEMDGETDALQESLRALTSAINKPVSQGNSRQFIAGPVKMRVLTPSTEDAEDEVIEADEEQTEASEEFAVTSAKPARQRAKRTPPTPQILENPGFDEGDPTWATFAESKPFDTDVLRVTAVAVWFKRVKKIDSVTIDHAYTAFKFVDWPTPDDIGQAFRNAKRQKSWFGTDGDGNWTVNIVGINAIDKLKKE